MYDLILENSQIYGTYFCNKLKGYFDEGQQVTVYSHYSLRLFTLDKNGKMFKVHYTDFESVFLTKEEWRNKKIKSILK
mgnify:CR=1 FL=1